MPDQHSRIPAFADLLRQHRLDAHLTQAQLATRAGLSVRTVSDLERGIWHFPRESTLHLLVEALGLKLETRTLFENAAKKPTPPRKKRTASVFPANLRPPATPFIGREQECSDLTALLRKNSTRLMTLIGPGGVGKTRLALHVALDIGMDFADGVHVVDLASLDDHQRVPATIAQSFGVSATGDDGLWNALLDHLAGKELLLVLDTFERVLDAADQVVDLLASCVAITVLVTSREALRPRAERRYIVNPLPVPSPGQEMSPTALADVPAVALFVDRAQAVHHGFSLTPENASAVASICRRLEGLPLAIELAAARTELFAVPELAQRLSKSMGVLADGPRDLPARQQTLRATLAWSYATLDPTEQVILRRLAVFAGGCTLEAAAAIAAPTDDHALGQTLAALAAHYFVRIETNADGTPRYRLPDSVIEFARGELAGAGEREATRDRHAAFFRDMAEESDRNLAGPGQRQIIDRLAADLDNLRAALTWAVESGDAETALRMASALWSFWEMRGYFREGRAWLVRALRLRDHAPVARQAKALTAAAGLADAQGDYGEAAVLYDQAIPLWKESGDRSGLAQALGNLGVLHDGMGDYDRAAALYGEALALNREIGDRERLAVILNNLGVLSYARSDFQAALAHHEESFGLRRERGDDHGTAASLINMAAALNALGDQERTEALVHEALAIYRALGDPGGTAAALLNLGLLAQDRNALNEAAQRLEEALVLQRQLGDKEMTAVLLAGLGAVVLRQGDVQRALTLSREALSLRCSLGKLVGIATALLGIAEVASSLGLATRAVRLIGAAEATFAAAGLDMHVSKRAELDRDMAALRDQLGEAAFLEEHERGRTLSVEAAIAAAFVIEDGLNDAERMPD